MKGAFARSVQFVLVAVVLFSLVGGLRGWASETRVLVDHLGRAVALPPLPQRVLALHRAFITDLLELGVLPIGRVEEYTYEEEIRVLPSIGSEKAPDLEVIYALAPDLIIANTRLHVPLLEALEKSGAAVFFIDPEKFSDPLLERVLLIAQVVGREDAGKAYAARLDALSAKLREQVARCGYHTAIVVQGGAESVLASQPTGMYHGLLVRLGLENVVPHGLPGAGRSTWVRFDIEAIMKADPDVFIVRAAGSSKAEDELLNYYRTAPEWQGVRAIREGRICVLPARVNPGEITAEEALQILANLLCPSEGH